MGKCLIIMDAGGVIFDWPKGKLMESTNEILKHNFSYIHGANRLWKNFYRAALVGKITFLEARNKWGNKLGLPDSVIDEIIRNDKMLYRKFTIPKRNINKVLRELKKECKIAILSNSVNTSKEMRSILKAVGINVKCFDKIFTSHDIGYKKPDARAYKVVLDCFRVKPQNAIFIGHSESELHGARRLGMKTVSLGKNKYSDISVKRISEIPLAVRCLK
jgi:putative hydrolase of the HAD superfamily